MATSTICIIGTKSSIKYLAFEIMFQIFVFVVMLVKTLLTGIDVVSDSVQNLFEGSWKPQNPFESFNEFLESGWTLYHGLVGQSNEIIPGCSKEERYMVS